MRLYFAAYSTDKEISTIKGAEYLLESYLLFKNKNFKDWHKKRRILNKKLFLDSGAFSAFTQGEKIDIDKYINFIKKNEQYLKVYASLDVIGDWEKSRKNLEYMESRGLKPLPTFHYASPIKELKRLVKKYDYIALGGLVPISLNRKKMEGWLDNCFSIIKGSSKVHGFGVNALWAWEKYPFYSVDATSWLMGGKFRRIVKFDQQIGKIKAYNRKSGRGPNEMKAHIDDYKKLNKNNIKEYLKMEKHITNLWNKRGIKWK